jgi:hypothetical protein
MRSRLGALLILLGLTPWLLPACPAHFDPLPDDDSAGGQSDDDDTGDDDTGDDDSMGDPILVSDPILLEEGNVYTLFLIGTLNNLNVLPIHDVSSLVSPGEHHARFVHAAATQPTIDVYVDGSLNNDLSGLMPASIYPDPATQGYTAFGTASSYNFEVYPTGATYGVDPPLVEPFTANLSPDMFYSLTLSGEQGHRILAQSTDDHGMVQAGKARVRAFHSVEGVQQINVVAELVESDLTLPLYSNMQLATMGNAWEANAGAMILYVYDAAATPE